MVTIHFLLSVFPDATVDTEAKFSKTKANFFVKARGSRRNFSNFNLNLKLQFSSSLLLHIAFNC